jgi:hypothetical protein
LTQPLQGSALQPIPVPEPAGLLNLGAPYPDEFRHAVPSNPCELDLDAFTIADHPVIVRILREGWLSHIPLSALTIELKDWLDAWLRFCVHIRRHLRAADPDGVAMAFVSHFEGIMERYDFKDLYWLYLEYDIHVRTLWESRPRQFSPALFYERT